MNQNFCDLSGHCITCSDEAVPMQVNELLAGGEIAICQGEGGARVEVLAGLLEGLVPGDVVLVHAGAALARFARESMVRDGDSGGSVSGGAPGRPRVLPGRGPGRRDREKEVP